MNQEEIDKKELQKRREENWQKENKEKELAKKNQEEQWRKERDEQDRKEAEFNQKKYESRNKNLIFFNNFEYGQRDFTDYLDFSIDNYSNKPIKYFAMYLVPFNKVNDEIIHDMTKKKWVKYIGDLEKTDYFSRFYSENLFWDKNIVHCLKVRKIEIEFADGTIKEFEDSDNLKRFFYDEFSEFNGKDSKFESLCDF